MFHSTGYIFTQAYYACDKACGCNRRKYWLSYKAAAGTLEWVAGGLTKKELSSLEISELRLVSGTITLLLIMQRSQGLGGVCALRANAQTALDDKALPVCANRRKGSALLLNSANLSHQIPCDPLPAGGTRGPPFRCTQSWANLANNVLLLQDLAETLQDEACPFGTVIRWMPLEAINAGENVHNGIFCSSQWAIIPTDNDGKTWGLIEFWISEA